MSTSVLSSKVDGAISVLADILENATFPDGEVTLAMSDSLKQQEAEPDFQASRALARIMFAGNPYSVIAPTEESIDKLTPAELRSEYARRFQPSGCIVVAIGDFDGAKMMALLKEKLGGWKASGTLAVGVAQRPTVAPPHSIAYIARPNSVQTTLVFGAFGPLRGDSDYEAAEVVNAIFGGTSSSRLYVNIREDKGYTYTPYSYLQILHSAGTVRTQSDVRNVVTGASFNEVTYEMDRLATTSPTVILASDNVNSP
jgi:predicted Zn-dependent peptidase